jgi:Arc/MetJ family transcription regulator
VSPEECAGSGALLGVYTESQSAYIGDGVTKRLVDLADEDLAAAREALQTRTIRETVTAALRLAAAQAARRREIERLTSGALVDLGKADVRDAAWRS